MMWTAGIAMTTSAAHEWNLSDAVTVDALVEDDLIRPPAYPLTGLARFAVTRRPLMALCGNIILVHWLKQMVQGSARVWPG
jgi:hypothetical protein